MVKKINTVSTLEYIPVLLIPAANRQVWFQNVALIQRLSGARSAS